MPVSVPTQADFDALSADVTDDQLATSQRLDALEKRVTALEAGTVAPPDPEEPPPDIEEPPPDIEPPPAGTLQATVDLGGVSYLFEEVHAVDIGSYTDPDGRFVMTCKRATLPELAHYRVDFRRIDGWSCIVFDYGDGLTKTEPVNLPEHTVSITSDQGTRGYVLPAHWHAARWRWQSGPWPHMRTITDMTARNWLPHLDQSVNRGTASPLAIPVYTPMGLAGLTAEMPATGGRADIGMVTDWQGEYLCTGSPEMLAGVLAQGEAGASIPWHFRDESTGCILDLFNTYRYASCYWTGQDNVDPYVYQAKNTGITIDVSHMPACAWVPFVLTGDPYYLETQQAMANFAFLDTPRSYEWVWQMPGSGQTRAMAWDLRTIAQALVGTPDETPSWLLSKSAVQMMLDQCLKGLDCIMNEGGTNRKDGLWCIDVGLAGNDEGGPAGYYPGGCYSKVWQTSFFCQAVGWASVLLPELREVAGYIAHHQIARTDGKVWDATFPSPYSVLLRSSTADNMWFKDWTECWAKNAPILGVPVSPLKNQLPNVGDYEGGTYAGLCALSHARKAGVTEIQADVDSALARYAEQMTALLGQGSNYLTWNNSYAR